MVTSSQRTALLEKHRYINVEFDNWWDCVETDFVEDMKKVGIQVDKVYFSGFYSQGDGACFVGKMDNTLTYLNHHHMGEFPMIRQLLDHCGDVYVTCSYRSGRYCHENCTSFWVDADTMRGIVPAATEFHEAIIEQWDRQLDNEMHELEKAIENQWRTYMQDVYRKLEAEYDHLTSDDAVWDTLEANELIEDIEE